MKALVVLLVSLTWCCCSGYQISECGNDGKVDLDEARPSVLTCTGITDDTVKWDVMRPDGTNSILATCTLSTSSCSSHTSGFDAKIIEQSTSTLTVTLSDRTSTTGMIRCGGSAMGSSLTSCNIRIVHKADKVSNCSVTVNNRDWTVIASCDVEKMFSSDGNYTCYWIVPTQNMGQGPQKRTFQLTNFTSNNKKYRRGSCVISGLPMPTADGVHDYSVIINPGVGLLTGPSLDIKKPSSPTLSNCPDSIRERRNGNCVCKPSNSSPPAVTTWYTDRSVRITVLQLTKVNSSMDGTKYTCTQIWGVNFQKTIVYTLRVESFTAVTTTSSTTMVPTNTISTTTHDAITQGEDKSVGDNNTDDTKDEGLPIAILAGGAGGGLIVIIIIVIVVVEKRRRGSSTEQRKVDTADYDFEEHINDMYESSDARPYAGTSNLLSGHHASNAGITTEPSTVNEESETAFEYSTVGSSAPLTTASAQQHNQILESDLYSTPDENGAQPPVAMVTQAAPKGADVYAVVNKPGKAKPQENPESEKDA